MSRIRFLMLALTIMAPAMLFAAPNRILRAQRRVEGEYLVRLRADVHVKSHGASIAGMHGGRLVHYFEGINTMLVQMTDAQAEALSNNPRVELVEENAIGGLASVPSPQHGLDSPLVPNTAATSWGLDRIYRIPGGPVLDDTYAWGFDGTGSQIYIVDTGVLPYHSEFGWPNEGTRVQYRSGLAAALNQLGGANHLDPVQCWYQNNFSVNAGHGTAVAAIAGGNTFGVAKGATIVDARAVDCSGAWTSDRIVTAIEWILNDPQRIPGRAVINLSITGPMAANPNGAALQAEIQRAAERPENGGYNVPVVVAAGNNNDDAANWLPANAPNAITVGGLARANDDRWAQSNYGGPNFLVAVYAPAEHIQSASTCVNFFDANNQLVTCPGAPRMRSELADCATAFNNTPDACTSGTSFAAPHVSGIVARELQWMPNHHYRDFIYEFFANADHGVLEPGTFNWVPILRYWDTRY